MISVATIQQDLTEALQEQMLAAEKAAHNRQIRLNRIEVDLTDGKPRYYTNSHDRPSDEHVLYQQGKRLVCDCYQHQTNHRICSHAWVVRQYLLKQAQKRALERWYATYRAGVGYGS